MFYETRKQIKITLSLTLFLLGFLLVGFPYLTRATDGQISQSLNRGQMLPIAATVTIGEQTINLEVADTPQKRGIGLMFRDSLPSDRGMIFTFDRPQNVTFWMKNVRFPLDMIFLQNGRIVSIAANVPPCTNDPCPSYGSPSLFNAVIELGGGRAAELGLQAGDRLKVEYFDR